MTVFEKMDSKVRSFTRTDNLIYDHIRKYADQFISSSIAEAADSAHTSQAAVTRFAKKLGYTGFTEFQFQLAKDLENRRQNDQKTRAEKYGDLLKNVESSLSDNTCRQIANKILRADMVYITGANFSQISANYMALSLSHERQGKIHFKVPDMLPIMNEHDMLIVISVASGSMLPAVQYTLMAENKPDSLLVTLNPKHPMRKIFSDIIVLPGTSEITKSGAVMSDTLAFMMFTDRIAEAMEQLNNESAG